VTMGGKKKRGRDSEGHRSRRTIEVWGTAPGSGYTPRGSIGNSGWKNKRAMEERRYSATSCGLPAGGGRKKKGEGGSAGESNKGPESIRCRRVS